MIAETILGLFSKDRSAPASVISATKPLELLQHEYPNLGQLVTGHSVLDFGCGHGDQAAALAREYQCAVTGLDTNPLTLSEARTRHGTVARFVDRLDGEQFDVIVSQDAMEHFPDPKAVLDAMLAALAPSGILLITFGPPWYAPYGSHMHFFCRIPWLNLLFAERTVMAVRARFRSDGAQRYEDVESGLNKMTLAKFERLMDRPDMRVESRRYTAVKRWNFLTSIPVVRELMTRHITVVIRKAVAKTAH